MLARNVLLSFGLAAALIAAAAAVEQAKKQMADKKFDQAVATLESAHKAKPKSTEIHKALGEAHLAKGESLMYNEALPPRQKYPGALRAYREVLKYDKENAKAKQQIATIEGIYKQMGRPVPE